MSNYIRRCREDAGLTQEQFAEKMQVSVMAVHNWETGKTKINSNRFHDLSRIFNVSVEYLIAEMLREEDKSRKSNWPAFLFDDDTNEIVEKLHLNLAQQDLFGLMYIYTSENGSFSDYSFVAEFDEKIKSIPYSFIEKIGSIRFINLSEKLREVLKYVNPYFLMDVLKQNPESEFDVMKLSKERIIDFIDGGSMNPWDHDGEYELDFLSDVSFHFHIKMRWARDVLPILEKNGPIHLSEEWIGTPIKDSYPVELINVLIKELSMDKTEWEKGACKKKGIIYALLDAIPTVTELKNTAKKGKPEHWMLSINDRGRELLKWFRE